jgi:hypothetical protein
MATTIKTFGLLGCDNYLEGVMQISLSDIPDCKGKYDIANSKGVVNDWDWIILYLSADISSFEEIFESRICNKDPKYNFIWGIIQNALKNDETHKEIASYEDAYLQVEIYPRNIFYRFYYYKGNRILQSTKETKAQLTVEQTVSLLESGVFTEVVDNGFYKED